MFKFGFSKKELKTIISFRDNSIKILQEKLHEKELSIVRLAAENAKLKQNVIDLETKLDPYLTPGEKAIMQYLKTGFMKFDSDCNPNNKQ